MPQLIECGRELIRINPATNTIEHSSDGRNWMIRFRSNIAGTFLDLCLYGSYIFAVTSKGIYVSRDNGHNWNLRCVSTVYGTFQTIMVRGTELYAQTSKGLYVSRDEGHNWTKR